MLRGGAAALALLLLAGSSTAEQPSPAFRRSAASLARLRGGSIVTNVGAGIIAGTGALAWISPSAAFEAVGMPNHDASALAFMRILGAYQLVLAAVTLASKKGPSHASAVGLFSTALAIVANIAVYEYFERPKLGSVAYAVLFVGLGSLTLAGKVGPSVAAGFHLLLGTLIHLTPKQTVVLYELTKPVSAYGYSTLALSGGVILTTGAFLLALARGLSQPQSFAVASACNALFLGKWLLLEAGALGAPILGAPAALTLASAALAAVALK